MCKETVRLYRHECWERRKKNNPVAVILARVKNTARIKGLDFDLDQQFLESIIPTHCPVFGIELGPIGSGDIAPSVDRIDSSKGYTKDNVVITCWKANRIKKHATPEELMKLAVYYSQHIKS